MISPGTSVTGSLLHAVSLFSRLFPAQEYPPPVSLTRNPNSGLAMQFTHGAGVHSPSVSRMTYSRPSPEKPPNRFGNCSDSEGAACDDACSAGDAGCSVGRKAERSVLFG